MKHIAIIGTILVVLLLTAGCLDDLSSTLPQCCDGTCDGVKTSVITVEKTQFRAFFESRYNSYIIDGDGIKYTWGNEDADYYDPYNNHNVTFSYEMVDGHRHITGIIEDHDAKPKCDCCQCVQKCCGCDVK